MSGQKFVDPDFFNPSLVNEEIINEFQKKNKVIEFQRITDLDIFLNRDRRIQLLKEDIVPGRFVLDENESHAYDFQLIAVLEALSYHPELLNNITSMKYELER